jgi:putative aminopeptidase FrvX
MRYSHSSVEVCDPNDMRALVALLQSAVGLIDNNTQWSR